jgi:hypothetical protein
MPVQPLRSWRPQKGPPPRIYAQDAVDPTVLLHSKGAASRGTAFPLGKDDKIPPLTRLMDGRAKYNTPWDKRALFLVNKYYKVQSAHGRYKVQKTSYHHQVGNAGNLGRAAPSTGRLEGTSSSQVFFLHPPPSRTPSQGTTPSSPSAAN